MNTMNTQSRAGRSEDQPALVWLESEDSAISRGWIEVFSADGALVLLTGAVPLGSGTEVAVRMAFSSAARTLAARARVRWVRTTADGTECELVWTHTGPERVQLAALVASLG